MSTVEVSYDCCGRTYTMASALREDSLLLANATLGDTLIMMADAQHDRECLR